MFSPLALIDAAIIILAFGNTFWGADSGTLTFLRFSRVLRALRAVSAISQSVRLTAVTRQLLVLLLTVVSIVFISSGLVLVFEQDLYERTMGYPREPPLTFGTSVYFTVVTLSSVGYGDVVAETGFGQVAVTVMIVFSLVLIPVQINQLTTLLSMQSKYRKPYKPKAHAAPPLLIVGHIEDGDMLASLLDELYHPDRLDSLSYAESTRKTVVLGAHEPNDSLNNLMLQPKYDGKLQYVRGSVMNPADLAMAGLHEAAACLVLSNPQHGKSMAEESDRAAALQAMMLKTYNPAVRVLVHMQSSSNLQAMAQAHVQDAVIVNEYQDLCMAQSLLVPGSATLINNMLHSIATDRSKDFPPWLTEYAHGAGLECYVRACPARLAGYSFTDAARAVYAGMGGAVTLMGVQMPAIDATSLEGVQEVDDRRAAVTRGEGSSSSLLILREDWHFPVPGRVFLNPGDQFKLSTSMQLFLLAEDDTEAQEALDEAMILEGMQPLPGPTGFADSPSEDRPQQAWAWDPAARPRPKHAGWKLIRARVGELQGVARNPKQSSKRAAPSQSHLTSAEHAKQHAQHLLASMVVEQVRDLQPHVTNHVVLIGALASMGGLVRALRAPHLLDTPMFKHIVVLCPPPDPSNPAVLQVLQLCSAFDRVSIVLGYASRATDIQRAGVSYAHAVGMASSEAWAAVDGYKLDVGTLFDCLQVERIIGKCGRLPSPFLVMSASSERNLSLLGLRAHQMALDAADAVHQPSAYPSAANVTFYAAGQGIATDSLHTLLSQAFYAPETLRFTESLLAPNPGRGSRLMLQPVPLNWHEKSYGALWNHLCSQGVIAIGVYRCRLATMSPRNYVFTGPPADTLLYSSERECDWVYLLTPNKVYLDHPLNTPYFEPKATRSRSGSFPMSVAAGKPAPPAKFPSTASSALIEMSLSRASMSSQSDPSGGSAGKSGKVSPTPLAHRFRDRKVADSSVTLPALASRESAADDSSQHPTPSGHLPPIPRNSAGSSVLGTSLELPGVKLDE